LSEGDEARLGSEQLVIFVEQDLSGVVHGDNAQTRASFGAQHLPGNDVGVMLEPSNDDFIALADILAAPALCNEIDALGCAADEDDFLCARSVEEAADLFACGFVGVGGASGEFVGGAMDVGIFVGVEVAEAVDDAFWFLRCCGVIEPDEGLAVDALLKDGEVATDGGGVERAG
jgi:hypothetical protein